MFEKLIQNLKHEIRQLEFDLIYNKRYLPSIDLIKEILKNKKQHLHNIEMRQSKRRMDYER